MPNPPYRNHGSRTRFSRHPPTRKFRKLLVSPVALRMEFSTKLTRKKMLPMKIASM